MVRASSVALIASLSGLAMFALGRFTSRRGTSNSRHARKEKAVLDALTSFAPKNMISAWPRPGIKEAEKAAFIAAAGEAIGKVFRDNAWDNESLEALRLKALLPPLAKAEPKVLISHGDERIDPYYWIRDDSRKDKSVLAYLAEENVYRKAVLADTETLQADLYTELRGHIQEADESVPVRHGPYFYYWKLEEGKQYKVHCRRKVGPQSVHDENEVMDLSEPEEILLDENKRQEDGKKVGKDFYSLGSLEVSPDHKLMAWSEDTVGRERSTLHVMDLTTRKELISPIDETSGEIEWFNDNSTFLFVTKDDLDRPYKVWRASLVGDSAPSLIFEETDESFYVGIGKSRSEKVLFISSGSAITSEDQICDASKQSDDFKVLIPRKHDVQYDALHSGDGNIFVLNLRDKERPNGEILLLDGPGSEPTVLLPHSSDVKIEGVSLSAGWLVVWQRKLGLQCATIFKRGSIWSALTDGVDLSFEDEPAYSIWTGAQSDFNSPLLRIVYTSLTTPSSTIDCSLETGKRAVKKVQPVPNFDKSLYATDRIWCMSHDGVKVPISLVYRKDKFVKDGTSKLLLDGYGSYEISNDPYFSYTRLPLLDRGFVYAIAHIRGGGEMGRLWYENGKYGKKTNTFHDFIAASELLISEGYTSSQHLAIEGRSAGGLLIGAVVNLRPDLFKSAIAGVPFVDCLTTMLDPTIPLTVIEWEEWGNPVENREVYDSLKSYSPMDNIQVSVKPNMLVTGGLHDPRVGYWEPAKYVAKLRENADPDSDRVTCLKMEMGAGHFSVTGRFEKLKETAEEWAFLLKFT